MSLKKFKHVFLDKRRNLKNWIFRWHIDVDNDLVFSVFNLVNFVKVKQRTMIVFGKQDYKDAPARIYTTNGSNSDNVEMRMTIKQFADAREAFHQNKTTENLATLYNAEEILCIASKRFLKT